MSNHFRMIHIALLFCLCWAGEAQAWNPQVINGRCKQSGNTCSGTIGNSGQTRGACCDPSKGTSATLTCEKNNTCTGGSPYKWADNNIPVKWWFNSNSMAGKEGYANMSESQIETLLKKAWDFWVKPVCTSFRHTYVGKSTNFLSAQDNQTTLFLASSSQWAQMGAGPSTLAFTRPVPDRSGRMIDADIAFNPRPSGRGWSAALFTSTAGHEIGHAIGFAHTGDPKALMYFAASGQKKDLSKDEVDAVCFTYKKKGPCSNDADCGGCLKCSGGKCVSKNIALVKNLCKPCKQPSDCGGSADICIRLEEGQRCAMACDTQGCCPNGYRCSDIGAGLKMCIPDSGKCPDVQCTTDTNCGPGESCQSGKCKPKPIPPNPKTCKECANDADCGAGGRCLQFDGKSRCLLKCVADNFCPEQYRCSDTGVGRICLPKGSFCPCATSSDCLAKEACRSGVCRPSECKYQCSCVDDTHCSPKHKCYQTGRGGVCAQPCGKSATSPNGTPGSACNGQTCTGGAQCFQMGGGRTVCMKTCRTTSDCRAGGGQCFRLGQQSFCLCQNDAQCTTGQACNKSVLGQFGGGACAAKATATCDKGFKCADASGGQGSLFICQPDGGATGNGDVGATCTPSSACKAGLQCLQVQQGTNSGVCFEECSGGKTCQFGGSCLLGSQGSQKRFCGCGPQATCKTGQTCKPLFQGGAGVCQGKATEPPKKCGNGTCDTGETCSSCAADCKCPTGKKCNVDRCVDDTPPKTCGDGRCGSGETCGNCAKDCACSTGKTCTNNQCVAETTGPKCGDNKCDSNENCSSCAADCGCPTGQACINNACGTKTTNDGGTKPDKGNGNGLSCPAEDQFTGADGKPTCPEPKTGCAACSVGGGDAPLAPLTLFGFLGLLLFARRRK